MVSAWQGFIDIDMRLARRLSGQATVCYWRCLLAVSGEQVKKKKRLKESDLLAIEWSGSTDLAIWLMSSDRCGSSSHIAGSDMARAGGFGQFSRPNRV